ncbi:MAG: hypothetical protein AAGA03_12495 [Planctomycetota bacterium]
MRRHIRPTKLATSRHGISLLEVTIASLLAGLVAIMASTVAMNASRSYVGNIAQSQMAIEARLVAETLRRDLGGHLPETPVGHRDQWRWVGHMVPASDELRLCFDSDDDASADWGSPDRVITYLQNGNRLVRLDSGTGGEFVVARLIDEVDFSINGGELSVALEFQLGNETMDYEFVTGELP